MQLILEWTLTVTLNLPVIGIMSGVLTPLLLVVEEKFLHWVQPLQNMLQVLEQEEAVMMYHQVVLLQAEVVGALLEVVFLMDT